jgi:hypothetical protein
VRERARDDNAHPMRPGNNERESRALAGRARARWVAPPLDGGRSPRALAWAGSHGMWRRVRHAKEGVLLLLQPWVIGFRRFGVAGASRVSRRNHPVGMRQLGGSRRAPEGCGAQHGAACGGQLGRGSWDGRRACAGRVLGAAVLRPHHTLADPGTACGQRRRLMWARRTRRRRRGCSSAARLAAREPAPNVTALALVLLTLGPRTFDLYGCNPPFSYSRLHVHWRAQDLWPVSGVFKILWYTVGSPRDVEEAGRGRFPVAHVLNWLDSLRFSLCVAGSDAFDQSPHFPFCRRCAVLRAE